MELEQFIRENCITAYDAQLEKILDIIHLPWIGKEYECQERRVLIVGDSHYGKEKETWEIDFTRGITKCCSECTVSESWNFQKNLLYTFGIKDEQVARFWRSVAFCNIVQEPMQNRDDKPTDEQFARGGRVLKEIIDVIKPTDCIIVGVRCERQCAIRKWEQSGILSKEFGEKIDNTYPFYGTYTFTDGAKMHIINIKHSSQGYTPEEWAKYIKLHLPEAFNQLSKI